MSMMCGPTWNSSPLPVACDLFATQKPPYIYEIPTLRRLGVRPAILSFMKLQKDLVRAARLIMGSFGTTRKTAPPTSAVPENAEPAAGRSRPVEHGCILRDKLWTRPHRGCNLLRIRLRRARCWHLSVGESCDEY